MRKIEADLNDLEAAFDSTGLVTVTKTTTQDIDYKLTENLYLDGGELNTKDAEFGDKVTAQVIDIDNILGYGANFVVKTWLVEWGLCNMGTCKILTDYKGYVLKDLYLRIKYTSVGTTNDVKVIVNYKLHRAI
jgi:hypothetical protein